MFSAVNFNQYSFLYLSGTKLKCQWEWHQVWTNKISSLNLFHLPDNLSAAWPQFWSLARLHFAINGVPENKPATIYANERNMVEAIITVQLLDKSGQGLAVTDDQLEDALYFCRYETSENLKPMWLISNEPGEYVNGSRGLSEKSPASATIRYVSKYISCTKHELADITEKIAVGIDIPGFGKFDTSRNGTTTKTPSGQQFKSPKSAEITAVRPIDYSIPGNLRIEGGEFETLRRDYKWAARLNGAGPFHPHWDGQLRRRIVYIRPNKAVTNQEKFQKHDISYDPVGNTDVSTSQIWWWHDVGSEPCFNAMEQAEGIGLPGAVVGRGGSDYQGIIYFMARYVF